MPAGLERDPLALQEFEQAEWNVLECSGAGDCSTLLLPFTLFVSCTSEMALGSCEDLETM